MNVGGWKWREGSNPKPTGSPLLTFWPVMFVLLSSSQQLLDILSDLLSFADDVLCAGKCWVWLHLQIIQLGDGAALSQPAAAPQPPPPAHASEGRKVRSPARIAAYCLYSAAGKAWFHFKNPSFINYLWLQRLFFFFSWDKPSFSPRIICLGIVECVVIVTFWHAALLLELWALQGWENTNNVSHKKINREQM